MRNSWTLRLDLDLRNSLGEWTFPDALIVQEDRNLVMGPQTILDLAENEEVTAVGNEAMAILQRVADALKG